MISPAINPLRIISSFWSNRYILGQLVKRDVLLRYRGAMFGLLWIFLSPLLMLAIFAFIFGHVFQTRWPQQAEMPFWLLLYVGLIAFNVFSETVSRSTTAVRGYPSFVKKIIFPLEILPAVPLGAALVHASFNFLLLTATLAWIGNLHITVLLLPLLLTPVIVLALGLSWFLAAWGVFIKDMTQIVPLMVQMLLFLSPVFYPVEAVPQQLQSLYAHNPLGVVIEAWRMAVCGQAINWTSWCWVLGASVLVCALGYVFFQNSREEFADVL